MTEQAVKVTYETIHRWPSTFTSTSTAALRHRRPKPGGKRYLDEVFVKIQDVQR
ncbi:hypothetical protein ACIA78_36130 [Streptomyces xanthochromogenes]|uniref:hypothetical protein n=1 Tax=Streptomyces xanthochromogenes TaxID=67384 RepID=UPI0037AC0A24